MAALNIMITTAGLDALVNAQGGSTAPIMVTQIGVTASPFITAPSLTALPGEIKRIAAISGSAVSETVIHMTGQDVSEDVYDVRGVGLYLADGTLFGVYGQADPIFRKVSISFFLFALDIAFQNGGATSIVFGDTSFLMPPASETVKGVAEIATTAETATGIDDERIITPHKLRQLLDAIGAVVAPGSDDFTGAFAALVARTITGAGLVTGGGSLADNRILSVLAASADDVRAGTATDRAVTPAALSGLGRSLGLSGHALVPGLGGLRLMWGRFTASANAVTPVVFPDAFAQQCAVVLTDGVKSGGPDSQDNPGGVDYGSITVTGFSVFSADDTATASGYLALGY